MAPANGRQSSCLRGAAEYHPEQQRESAQHCRHGEPEQLNAQPLVAGRHVRCEGEEHGPYHKVGQRVSFLDSAGGVAVTDMEGVV